MEDKFSIEISVSRSTKHKKCPISNLEEFQKSTRSLRKS